MTTVSTEVNRFLFRALGLDIDREGYPVDDALVSAVWPFKLRCAGSVALPRGGQEVFTFEHERAPHYALWPDPDTFPAAGVSLADVRRLVRGAAWIREREPVSLAQHALGGPGVPPAAMRRAAVEALVYRARGRLLGFTVVEGLLLRRTGQHLALVEDERAGECFVVGTGVAPRPSTVPLPSAARRLAHAVGALLEEGALAEK